MNRLLMFFSIALSLLANDSLAADSNAKISSSGAGYLGTVMLNQAAGEKQQQVNSRAIAMARLPTIKIAQQNSISADDDAVNDFSARIQGDAFRGGSGVLGVNQGAGMANQQINNFQLGGRVSPDSLDDSSLAQSAASLSTVSAVRPQESGQRLVEIDDQAFSGSRGVVQLNQGAGVGNRMINNLGIRIVE